MRWIRGRASLSRRSSERQRAVAGRWSPRDPAADVRLALRGFVRNPVLTLVAVVTLALGIGATTAVFSVVHGVLLKPLPYRRGPGELVALTHAMPGIGMEAAPLSPALYRTFRDHARCLSAIGLWRRGHATVTGMAEPESVTVILVTDGLFPMLGLSPVIGRGFSAEEMLSGGTSPVILSYGYWRSRFGGDPDVLERSLTLEGQVRPIIGVMPPDTRIQDRATDVFLPLRLDRTSGGVGNWSFPGIARLKPGVTAAEATRELSGLTPLACELYPGIPLPELERRGFSTVATPLRQAVVGSSSQILWVVFGGVWLVLLIACANVANLFLLKSEARSRELAVRRALGASRGRLVRQILTESVLIGLAGGAAGLLLASAGVGLLLRMAPPGLPRLQEISLDSTALIFTLAVAIGSGTLAGLLPALRKEETSLVDALRAGGRGGSGGRGSSRTNNLLAAAQIALAFVLLAGAGLMVRTFVALRDVPPGYRDPAQVLTFRITVPPEDAPTPEAVGAAHREILERLRRIPGVTSVSAAASVAMEGAESWEDLMLEDFPVADGDPNPLRCLNWIAPGYFSTLGDSLVAGRDFEWADVLGRRHVAIVSEAFAREYWADPRDALGRRFKTAAYQPWQEIVGVAGDIRTRGVTKAAPATVYLPFVMEGLWGRGPYVQRELRYVVRTSRPQAASLLGEARRAVWSVNGGLPLARVQTLDGIFARSVARTTFTLAMLVIAALTAAILGVVGVYGVLSFVVSRRTREMAIRMAMGASRARIGAMVLRQTALLAGVAIVAGAVIAVSLARLLEALLFGVDPVDPVTYGAAAAALVAAALVAGWLPAMRAARVDPLEALRAE